MNKLSDAIHNLWEKPRLKYHLSDFLITIGIMAIATVTSLAFRYYSVSESNIIMVYILGVLFVARQTNGFFYGILASFLGVMSFNFFFTVPYYTFVAHGTEYPFTFCVMLLIALITSALTTKFKREAELSRLSEKRTQSLYNISRNLIATVDIQQTIATVTVNIANMSGNSTAFYFEDSKNGLSEPYIYCIDSSWLKLLNSEENRKNAAMVFKTGKVIETPCVYFLPVLGRSVMLGVIGIDCRDKKVSKDQAALLDTIAVQVALSLEREMSYENQQKSKVRMESERLRSNLLHSVSHDLKTPLAGIVGASSTILDNWGKIDDTTKKSLLSGIYDEAQWLSNSVDNILNITRIEDGRIQVKKSPEAVEEIVAGAVARIQKYSDKHIIDTDIPSNVMMVPMDGNLIEQVLVNLLDNAIKYSQKGSRIMIHIYRKDKDAVFEVSDSGRGIDEKDLPYIFDRFYTTGDVTNGGRKGIGLGLAICKSIVIAHGGSIYAANKENGGAIITFTIPMGA